MNELETTAGMAETPGYRYADVVGDQLFLAGQVPIRSDGALVGEQDPTAQTRACLDNLVTLVELHGFSLDDIRHLTIHVVGPHQHLLDAWSAVTDWFTGAATTAEGVPPATLLGTHSLGYAQQLVEVDARIVRAPSEPGR